MFTHSGKYVRVLILIFVIPMWITVAKRFTEGGKAGLVFHYYGEPNISVSLRIKDRIPFYSNGDIHETGLTASQRGRFDVRERCFGGGKALEVSVKIKNVSREDAEAYICDVYREGEQLKYLSKRIKLAVHFPLGRASCKVVPHLIDTGGIWDLLQCTASVGMEMGYLECYQNGERVPPVEAPNQNTTTLIQHLWMKKNVPVFCCSSTYGVHKDKCNCTDFYLDPVNESRQSIPVVYNKCSAENDNGMDEGKQADDNSDNHEEQKINTADNIEITQLFFQVATVGMLTYIIFRLRPTLSKDMSELVLVDTKQKQKTPTPAGESGNTSLEICLKERKGFPQ